MMILWMLVVVVKNISRLKLWGGFSYGWQLCGTERGTSRRRGKLEKVFLGLVAGFALLIEFHRNTWNVNEKVSNSCVLRFAYSCCF